MLNGKECLISLPDFLIDAQKLLAKSDDCLAHLEVFINDKDAIECLLGSLLGLANKADALGLHVITDFSLRINRLLSLAHPHIRLQDDALRALENCFALLAWQLELIDAETGLLALDDAEQLELLYSFATVAGLESELPALVPNTTSSSLPIFKFDVTGHQ